MDKRKTGEMIRKARTAKGYTQTELGALLNVSNKAVSRWEIGETFPDVAVLEQLATVLDYVWIPGDHRRKLLTWKLTT